jgi:hypothetical protein
MMYNLFYKVMMKFKFWQLVNKFRTAWATGFSKSSARPSTPTYTELPTQPEGFYARQYYEYMTRRNPETYKASTALKPIEYHLFAEDCSNIQSPRIVPFTTQAWLENDYPRKKFE